MEGTGLTTFTYLVERAARHPTIVRRSQMHKVTYMRSRELPGRTSL